MKQRILFCNIAYMKYYDTNYVEIPENGGSYVKNEKDALEKHNFEKCSDGYYRGFVETKHSKGYKLGNKLNEYKSLRIENIDNSYVKMNLNSAIQPCVITPCEGDDFVFLILPVKAK